VRLISHPSQPLIVRIPTQAADQVVRATFGDVAVLRGDVVHAPARAARLALRVFEAGDHPPTDFVRRGHLLAWRTVGRIARPAKRHEVRRHDH
jgi:hypothetical protein